MRAFVAIALPEAIRVELGQQQDCFRATCAQGRRDDEPRWTRPEGIHLTLKFLGQISDEQVGPVTEALKALGAFEKFSIEVKGFGFFPDARRPRVLWAGIGAPRNLALLAQRVEDSMAQLGFAPENRAFSPHLTLARFKIPRPQPALQASLAQQADRSLGRFEVSEFFLFESRLSPGGAEYIKVARSSEPPIP